MHRKKGETKTADRKNRVEKTQVKGRKSEGCKFFADRASKIPQVFAAYAVIEEGIIDLWTIVEGDLYEAEGKVIEVENELLDRFSDLSFDFMVLPKSNQKLQVIIPSNGIQIYSRNT